MNLYLVEKALKIKIPLQILQQNLGELLDPMFSENKIGEWPIMNVKVDREENNDINHQARHIIKMTRDWIKKLFQLDSIPKTMIF